MTIELFATEVADRVHEILTREGAKVENVLADRCIKNNAELEAVIIKEEGVDISPTIYINSFWEQYQDGLSGNAEEALNETAHRIVDVYKESAAQRVFYAGVQNILLDVEKTLQNVLPCLVRVQGNEEYLEDKVWRPFMDMALIYRGVLAEIGGSFVVNSAFAHKLNISEEVLYEAAVKNAARYSHIASMSDVLAELMGGPCVEVADLGEIPMYTIRCMHSEISSAGCIVSDEVLRKFANEKNVERFFIIPSSVFECIAVVDPFVDPECLRQMVEEVNATEVLPEERLTDSVYVFDVATGLSIA